MTTGEGGASGEGDNAGGTGQGQGGDGNNSTGAGQGGTTEVFASLSDENRAFIETKGLSAETFDFNKVVDMHRNADKLISQGAHKQQGSTGQGDDAVPANPAGYEFSMPDKMPDGLPYDKGFAEAFAAQAHNMGLPKSVAGKIHDFYVSAVAEQFNSSQQQGTAQLNESVTKTFDTLTEQWGQKETPGFQRNMELSQRAMKHLDSGFKQALVDAGVIRKMGDEEVVTNPSIMLGLQKVGAAMFEEDSQWGDKPLDKNPFDPAHQNLTRQGEIIRENRELAKQLIRAAGVEADWGHVLNR